MISSIEFTSGFPLKIYEGKPLKYEFTDGFNIIFGTNGCGKSLMLRFLKTYASIPNAGWSRLLDPMTLGTNRFPLAYSSRTPEKVHANVVWDGRPAFYNAGDISVDNTWFFQNVGKSSDGITTEKEQFMAMVEKPSSGQYRLQKLNKILQIIGEEPDIFEYLENSRSSYNNLLAQRNYLKSLPRNGKITILLDEPERSLSLPKQKKLLEVLLEFSKDYQIIAACHSPFVLDLPRDQINIIEIDEGYVEECDKLFNFKYSHTGEPQQQEFNF